MKVIPPSQLIQSEDEKDSESKEGTAQGSNETAKKVPKVKRKYTLVSNE